MTLDLKNMPFGTLNPDLTQRSVEGSVSRRRSDPEKLQNNHMAEIATGHSTLGKLQFQGVVLSTHKSKYGRRGSNLIFQSPAEGFETEYKHYTYRVHLRDLFGYPDPPALGDPRIPTMTEARLDLSALSSTSAFGDANNNYDLTSRTVLIEFDNPRMYKGARIVSVGTYVDLPLFESTLQNKMVAGQQGGFGGAGGAQEGGEQTGGAPGGTAGSDMSCPTVHRPADEANNIGMTILKGTDKQTGKKLHSSDWTSEWPSNTVSTWILPLKPGEAKPNILGSGLNASSGVNRANGAFHKALDIGAKTGTPIYAVQDGTVDYAPRSLCRDGKPSTCGNWMRYSTIDGYSIKYCHMDMPAIVKKGQQITKGQIIGYVGDTGSSQGSHLHWQVRQGGKEGAVKHPGDFYPDNWILLERTQTPITATRRKSIPTRHEPVTV